jgi:hypothetical protein
LQTQKARLSQNLSLRRIFVHEKNDSPVMPNHDKELLCRVNPHGLVND